MTDTDPFRGREPVKSDRRIEQEAEQDAARGEVPDKAADIKAWIEDAPDRDERHRRASLVADVEGQRSSPRSSVLNAAEDAFAEDDDDEG